MNQDLRPQRIQYTALYLALLIALLALGGYLLCANITLRNFADWDEARHAVNAYEMIRNDDYVVHTYQDQTDYWNLKPPLSYWLIVLGYRVFGYTQLAVRWYSMLSGFFILVVFSQWVRRRSGGAGSLVTLGLLVACDVMYGVRFARFGDPDAMFVLFYAAAMFCMVGSEKDPRLLYGSAACFGLCFMLRSWHAATIPVTCLAYLLVTGQLKRLRVKNYLLLIALGLLPVLPWAVMRFLRDGAAFFTQTITYDVVYRATTVMFDYSGDLLYFVRAMLAHPAVVIAGAFSLAGLVWTLIKNRRLSKSQIGLLLWFVVPNLIYPLAQTKIDKYIFPAMFALMATGGMGAAVLFRELPRRSLKTVLAVALTAAFGVLTAGNLQEVSGITGVSGLRKTLEDGLNREDTSGMHLYIQRTAEDAEWRQSEVLYAELRGDMLCKEGGLEAFEEEEESALLLVEKLDFDETLLESYPIYYEDTNGYLLENLM